MDSYNISHLILDTGVFIRQENIFDFANENISYYTTEQVISEIKDEKSKHFYDKFPYEIKIFNPDTSIIKFVNNFVYSDLPGLSDTDISVIALTYQLELSINGTKNAKSVPGSDIKTENNDEDGWIGPDNFDSIKNNNSLQQFSFRSSDSTVACITTDMRMQAALQKLNLRLFGGLSSSIAIISDNTENNNDCIETRYDLYCYGCEKYQPLVKPEEIKTTAKNKTKFSKKEFCEYCGGHTLTSVRTTLHKSPDGKEPIVKHHLSQKYRYNLKGTIYSVPKPNNTNDRHKKGNELILREDVLAKARHHPRRKGQSSINTSTPQFGWGKKNPNIPRKKI